MNVAVLGATPLAEAVRINVAKHFSGDSGRGADILWVCDSREYVRPTYGQLVILSWPQPLGTCARWEQAGYDPSVSFVVVPENVREASAVEDFARQPFMCVGMRPNVGWRRPKIEMLLAPFTDEIVFMSPESAEMTKHALNSFLALQILFGNALGRVCDDVGADARDVVSALRCDPRIGEAYLMPGGSPGPHLLREVGRLADLGFDL